MVRKPFSSLSEHDKDYCVRASELRKLGFKSYKHFQRSKLWESIKAKLFQDPMNYFCKCCSNDTKALHHTSYSDLRSSANIIPVCGQCHKTIHWLAKVEKLSLLEATNRVLKAANRKPIEPFTFNHENTTV